MLSVFGFNRYGELGLAGNSSEQHQPVPLAAASLSSLSPAPGAEGAGAAAVVPIKAAGGPTMSALLLSNSTVLTCGSGSASG
jgi:hypothetical protein